MEIVAIIPAYNEEKYIGTVVKKASHYVDRVIVVDDGSYDNTYGEAKASGASVIRSPKNEGKARAIKRGLEKAKDSDVIVLMDGDLQHPPEEIPSLLECISDCDLCIGSRFLSETPGMPFANRISNYIASTLISILGGVKITDPQSGFRAIKTSKLLELELKAERYAIEHIMILEAARKGFRIKEVPISCIYAKEKTSIRPFYDTLIVMYHVISFLVRK
jgi:glycosyltransferase involved in cell wall biosynthesis